MTSYVAKRCIQLLLGCGMMAACSSSELDTAQSSKAPSAMNSLVSTKPLPGGRRIRAALYETNQHTETTTVVRTQSEWESLWQRIGPTPRPEIDFEREMLVVAGLGLGGWDRDVSIRVDGSRTDSLVAIVHVRDGIPDLCAKDAFRAPVEIVRVARDARPVVFRKEFEHLDCGRQDLAARRGAGRILTTRLGRFGNAPAVRCSAASPSGVVESTTPLHR